MSVNRRNETPRIPSELWRVIMDGNTFDHLIKQLATTRVSRLTALRGLAGGAVAALTGVELSRDDVDAADDKKTRKRRVCLCATADPGTCNTKKVKARKARRVARRACNYKGRCRAGVSGCPAASPAPPGFNCNAAGCVGANAGLVCNTTTGQCVNCQTFADCSGLQACFSGRCQGFVRCSDDGDCEGIAPSGLLPGLICHDNNESPEIEDNVCIFNPLEGACNNTNDCVPFMGLPVACVLGACFADCRQAGDDDCDKFYIPGTHHCVGGICFV
jgi:hypothetical protein